MLYVPKVTGYIHRSFGFSKFIILGVIIIALLEFWRTKFVQQRFIPLLLRLKTVWQHWATGISSTTQMISRFGWFLIAGATLTVLSVGFFLKLAHELLEQELGYFDQMVGEAIISLRAPWLTSAMGVITNFGSTPVIVFIIVLLTVLGIIYRRLLFDIIVLDLCIGGGLGLMVILKSTFQRTRPPLPWLGMASGYSFPSGHALMTMSLYGFLAYLIIRNRRHLNLLALLFIILALGVGISRVYLGVHFASDVIAGWAIAAAWLGTCIAGREILRKAVANRNGTQSKD